MLNKAGHSRTRIRELTGASERTIQRVVCEPAVTEADVTPGSQKAKGPGRPSKAAEKREFVLATLEAEPGLPTMEILRRARADGYRGGKSALFALVASLRPPKSDLVTRFEGVAGEFSQHDFGHVDVTYVDGRRERVHFFASRLKYSRWTEVDLVPNEQAETLVRALCTHFERWGGCPLLAIFDRPKTVALEWGRDGRVTQWNPLFASAILSMGAAADVCWPHAPWQKGAVENLVGWVKSSFFKPRKFLDEVALREQLTEWLQEVNRVRPSRATEVIPAARLPEEQARMRPLRVTPCELALPVPVHVGPTAMVVHETCAYSMPPEAAGIPGTLFLYPDRVRIVAGKHEAEHPRLFGRRERSSLSEHRAARLAAVSGSRGRQYLKRQDLLDLGEVAERLLTEIVHQMPGRWYPEVDQLHALLQTEGADRVRLAMHMAIAEGHFRAMAVAEQLSTPSARQLELPI